MSVERRSTTYRYNYITYAVANSIAFAVFVKLFYHTLARLSGLQSLYTNVDFCDIIIAGLTS